jgi:hypothetical protein
VLDEQGVLACVDVHHVLAEPEVVLADCALKRQIRATEHNSASKKTSSPGVNYSTAGESNPVKVVGAPVASKGGSHLDNALLLGGVKTNSVKEAELEPGGVRVAVSNSGLVVGPVLGVQVVELGGVSEFVTAKVLSE